MLAQRDRSGRSTGGLAATSRALVCAVRPRSGEMAVGLTSRSAGLGSRVGGPDSRTGRPDRRPQLVLRSATDRLIDRIAADLRLTTQRW